MRALPIISRTSNIFSHTPTQDDFEHHIFVSGAGAVLLPSYELCELVCLLWLTPEVAECYHNPAPP